MESCIEGTMETTINGFQPGRGGTLTNVAVKYRCFPGANYYLTVLAEQGIN